MEKGNNVTQTFVGDVKTTFVENNESNNVPNYFWTNDGKIVNENFDAKYRDKSRYENKPISTMEKEINKRVADFMRNENPSKMDEKFVQIEDVVNHPKHYNSEVFPQAIDMMLQMFGKNEVLAFCKLNAFKYRMRAGIKDSNKIEEDIKKAIWYETKFKELNQPQTEEKQILKG